jgi:hypothetical protein
VFSTLFVAGAGALYSWCPSDLNKAKALMQYNLATAHAIRDEQDKAVQNLSKVCISLVTSFPGASSCTVGLFFVFFFRVPR